MPVDYSKWDALELSDDSDIEVHPNVDKRSFIRAKQSQIHVERQQRRQQIEIFKYERIINDALIKRISALLTSLQAHAEDATSRNPGEVAFQAVMESGPKSAAEDMLPPRPEGLDGGVEMPPTYTKMMAAILDQSNKALDEKKVEPSNRYAALVGEVSKHLKQVTDMQGELHKKLAELEKEEGRKITSESYHTGFDSSHITKPTTSAGKPKEETKMELLNPNFDLNQSTSGTKAGGSSGGGDDDDDDDDVEASPTAKQFARISQGDYRESLDFISRNPQILTEKETDGLLVEAFNAALEGKDEYSRQCVHQALLLQYCRALGKDGVGLFFKRITTKGHQAQEIFYKDVQDTYTKIRTRAKQIVAQRAAEGTDGVEQIQLHAVEPGTTIQISVPPADSDDEATRQARAIFDSFTPAMRKALESGELDEVNKVLGSMKVDEAEELVGLLGEAGCLGIEEQLIDATTEEGRRHLEELEKRNLANAADASKAAKEEYGDPE